MSSTVRSEERVEVYEGKAKRVRPRGPGLVEIFFKDDATAGNGRKRAEFPGKGALCSQISELLLRYLMSRGIATHWLARVDARTALCRAVEIVPIEVVVRFRVAGSLAARTGLAPGTECEPPLVELYYKRDDLGDPLLTEEHVLFLKLATREELHEMRALALRASRELRAMLLQSEIDLYDLKLEMGWSAGELLIADEISPDTCRFRDLRDGRVLDKDVFRRDLAELVPTYEEVLGRLLGSPFFASGEVLPAAAALSPQGEAGVLAPLSYELLVRPREGSRDPQAEAVGDALRDAGFTDFSLGSVGRYLRIEVNTGSPKAARERIAQMCRAMLVNPNLETCELRMLQR